MSATGYMILGLVIGLAALIVLVLFTKVHAVLAIIVASVICGLIGQMGFPRTMAAIVNGFGSTIGGIGLIIAFGIMMGAIFEMSGAAKRMAQTFLTLFGKGREEWALGATGFVVSIPIFCDSGFIILAPLAKAIAKNSGRSLVTCGVALAGGLVITHHLVPPTPGPIASANNFGVDLGTMVAWALPLAAVTFLPMIAYAKYIGTKVFIKEDGTEATGVGEAWKDAKEEDMPSAFLSFAPIVVPIVLILYGTFTNAIVGSAAVAEAQKAGNLYYNFVGGISHPVVAVGIGLLLAIYTLTGRFSVREVVDAQDKSLTAAGVILLVTGAGGALGMVLRDSGAAKAVADTIATWPLPTVILPILIATIVRFMQGSGTVAMVTSSAIVGPMAASLGLEPVIGALGCCAGSFFFGYFNDSYYWVVNRTLGIVDTREQIRVWSINTTICWATSCAILIILDIIF